MAKSLRITEAEAIEIAVSFAKSKHTDGLKWDEVRARFEKAGGECGYKKDTWSVVFPKNLPPNVAMSPDISVVLVDATTGKAKWFLML